MRRWTAPGTARIAMVTLALWALVSSGGALASPAGSLPGLDGSRLGDSELASGNHVLVVWASWSPRCRDIVPRVNELGRSLGGRARLATVNFQEDPTAIEEFLRREPLQAPVYLDRDGGFSKSHAVTTLPGLIVVRDGKIVYQGRLEADASSQVDGLLR